MIKNQLQSVLLKHVVMGCVLFFSVFGANNALAYFMDAVDGVRPAGMGSAFVAIADDANSAFFNAAGYAGIRQVEVMGMYSGLYLGLDDRQYTGNQDRIGYSLVSAALPFESQIGSFGVAWSQFYSELYWENQFYLSYARSILKAYNIDMGITVKALNWSVANTIYTDFYPTRDKWGTTLDVGFLSEPVDGLHIGVSVDNVIPVDMGLYSEAVTPMVFRVGGAYFLPWKIQGFESMQTQLELNARHGVYNVKFGFETWLSGNEIGLRTGVNVDQATLGFSYWKKLPGQPFAIHFDYAFAYPFQMLDTFGSHRAGLTLSWDPHYSEQQIAAVVERAERSERMITQRLEETSRELATSEAEIKSLEEKHREMELEIKRAKQARRARQVEGEERAKAIDRAQAKKYRINTAENSNVFVIGYETKFLSEYMYIQEVRDQFEKFENFMKQQTGHQFTRRGFATSESLTHAFQQGEIDMIIPSDGIFATLYKQGIAKPFVTFSYKEKDFQNYSLFVQQTDQITNLADLKHKRLGYIREDAKRRLNKYLAQNLPGYSPEDFFRVTRKMESSRGGLMALRLQDIDVLVGPEYIETILNRESKGNKEIRVIEKFGFVPNVPVFVRTGLVPEKKEKLEKIQEVLFTAQDIPEYQSFLDFFYLDKLVPFQKRYQRYFKNQ